MIDPRPSAVDMAHSWTPPWHPSRWLLWYRGTVVPCQLVRHAHADDEVRRIPETRPVAVRLVSVSRAWGSNRCLQQVPLGRGLEAHSDFIQSTCPQGLDTLLDLLRLRSLGAALGARLSTWLPKQSQACQHVPI